MSALKASRHGQDRAADGSEGETAIWARGLRKRYADVEAVRGINLTVQTGEIFAFLGPNGAGKTTTVEMLEGYRCRDAGEVTVLGADPAHPSRDWRARLGVVLQTSKMPDELTVRELVERYAGSTRTRGTSARRSSWSAWRTSGRHGPTSCPAGSCAGWMWHWPSSATQT